MNSGTAGRRIVTVVSISWAAGVFLFVLGALFPSAPLLGLLGTILESFLSLHILILGVIGVLLGVAAWQLGSRRGAILAATLAALAVIGALVPLLSLTRTATRYGAAISWWDHLRITAPGGAGRPNATVRFATVDGKDLYADIYLPARSGDGLSAPVLMMHPGGYVKGERSMGADWDRWLAERGYTVFDVDYRLAPPVTGNSQPRMRGVLRHGSRPMQGPITLIRNECSPPDNLRAQGSRCSWPMDWAKAWCNRAVVEQYRNRKLCSQSIRPTISLLVGTRTRS